MVSNRGPAISAQLAQPSTVVAELRSGSSSRCRRKLSSAASLPQDVANLRSTFRVRSILSWIGRYEDRWKRTRVAWTWTYVRASPNRGGFEAWHGPITLFF